MTQRICSFDGCPHGVFVKGLCNGHYTQLQRGRELAPLRYYKPRDPCSFDGCDRDSFGRGLCRAHFDQQKLGYELKPLRIKWHSLREKMEHYLETDANGCWIWQLSLGTQGYGRVQWKGKFYQVHRQLWLELGRDIPEGLELDHLCRVRACANPDHLEPVTHKENMWRSPIMQARWLK